MEKFTIGYVWKSESGSFHNSYTSIESTVENCLADAERWRNSQLEPDNYVIIYIYRVENHRPVFIYPYKGV